MRAALHDLQLDDWLDYAADHVGSFAAFGSGASGVVGIEEMSGYLHGLLVFRVEVELRLGRTLKCEHVVVANLIREGLIARYLLDAIDRIARSNDCAAIQVAIGEPSGALARFFEEAGLSRDLTVFRKPLPRLRMAEDLR